MRRLSDAIDESCVSTDATRRSTPPRTGRGRYSMTTAPSGRPSASERRHEDVPGARQERREQRVADRVEPADRQEVLARPREGDDRVRFGRGRRGVVDADRGEDDDAALGGSQDDASLDVKPGGEAVEDDLRLLDRIGHVVELRAQLDERLEVGPALAELALVHRREDRRREREQPERRDVEDRHPVELDRPRRAGRRPAGTRAAAWA